MQEPWAGMTSVEVAIGVVTEDMRLPMPDTLPWLQSLVAACWSTNPEERPTFEAMSAEIGAGAGLVTEFKARPHGSTKNSKTSASTSADHKSASSLEGQPRNYHNPNEISDDSTYQPVTAARVHKNI